MPYPPYMEMFLEPAPMTSMARSSCPLRFPRRATTRESRTAFRAAHRARGARRHGAEGHLQVGSGRAVRLHRERALVRREDSTGRGSPPKGDSPEEGRRGREG